MNKTIAVTLFLYLLLILAFGALLLFVPFGPWDHDSGYYLLVSSMRNAGLLMYRDFPLQYPPLQLLINSGLMSLPLSRNELALLIPSFWLLSNLILTFFYSLKVTEHLRFSLLMGIIYCWFMIENGANHVTLEQGVIFFGLLACLVLTPFINTIPKLMMAFCMSTFSLLCKQIGVLFFIPTLFQLIFMRPWSFKLLIASFMAVLTPILLVFQFNFVDLNDITKNIFLKIVKYGQAKGLDFSIFFLEFQRSPFSIAIYILVILCGFILYQQIRLKKKKNELVLLFIQLLLFFLFLGTRLIRNFPHYSINTWPLIVCLFCLSYKYGHQIFQYFPKALAITLLVLSLYMSQSMINKIPSSAHSSVLLGFFAPLAEEIKKLHLDESKILQLGEEPIIEFLSAKLPSHPQFGWSTPYDLYNPSGEVAVLIDHGKRVIELDLVRKKLVNRGYRLSYENQFPNSSEPIYVGQIYQRQK